MSNTKERALTDEERILGYEKINKHTSLIKLPDSLPADGYSIEILRVFMELTPGNSVDVPEAGVRLQAASPTDKLHIAFGDFPTEGGPLWGKWLAEIAQFIARENWKEERKEQSDMAELAAIRENFDQATTPEEYFRHSHEPVIFTPPIKIIGGDGEEISQ